jgi:hypothetical protein
MTKYVLNSGGLRNYPDKGKKFLAEIVNGLGPTPKMLVTLFAQPREDWAEKFAQYENELNNYAPEGVKLSFELAFPDTFTKQVKNCDVVYIHGGDDHLLKYWFSQIDIPNIWQDKVVATSSAGSNMLTKNFWTCDWRMILDGFGILQIKFIPHYNSDYGKDDPRGLIDWGKALKELEEYGDKSLPIHALSEGDFVVINQ